MLILKKKEKIPNEKSTFIPQGARERTKLRVSRRRKTIEITVKINKIKNIKWYERSMRLRTFLKYIRKKHL